MLLNAEHSALSKKTVDEADELYQRAIDASDSLGHLQHSGLFNERYADFLLEKRASKEYSQVRLKEAIRYYKEWGAVRKVQTLESRL